MSKTYKVVKLSRMLGSAITTWQREELAKVDAELIEISDENKSELVETIKDAHVILSGAAPRWIIEAAPKCIAIITGNVGFDGIDVVAATENNILVVNNPSFEWCVEEVSNHALTLLLACAKKVKMLDHLVSQGRWTEAKQAQTPMGSVYGQTLGIVGCGAIGRMVARKAKCFGLNVIGYDPYMPESYIARENGISLMRLGLTLKADYVSLHPDLNEKSFHLIDDGAFAQMKPSAYLINTARGKVVDEAALIRALKENRIAGAGLDVFEDEPLSKNSPLTKMENVIVLPHSASYSDESFKRPPVNSIREACRILTGKLPLNVVNKLISPRNLAATMGR